MKVTNEKGTGLTPAEEALNDTRQFIVTIHVALPNYYGAGANEELLASLAWDCVDVTDGHELGRHVQRVEVKVKEEA